MAFCQIHWYSEILSKQTTTSVLLPDGAGGPYATFYLLHGLSDDHSMWHRRTRIEMYVSGKPLIVVMPDGGRGFYTNHENGPRWAEHIGMELPTMIERTFPAMAARNGRFIGGLSMGGYGAIRVGLGYPHRFASINSHSGAVMFGSMPQSIPERVLMVGPNPVGTDHDVIELARKAKAAGNLPRLLVDCGVDDFVIEHNRTFHQSLTQAEVDHQYKEFPGAHDWDYWDLHVRNAIAFHLA